MGAVDVMTLEIGEAREIRGCLEASPDKTSRYPHMAAWIVVGVVDPAFHGQGRAKNTL